MLFIFVFYLSLYLLIIIDMLSYQNFNSTDDCFTIVIIPLFEIDLTIEMKI